MGMGGRAHQARRPIMKNMLQLSGNIEVIACLYDTLVSQVCGFNNGCEFEDLDDIGMIRVYPENIPAPNYLVLLTSLYYRLQDPLFAGIDCNIKEFPEPADNVFRITASNKQSQKIYEDFFVYNNISEEQVIRLVYPLSYDCSLAKVEMIAIGLSEDEMAKLNKQGKTTVVANKVHNKIEKVGSVVHTTGRIMANDVVNPLATAAAKTTATIVSAGAKTIVDCGIAAANEILRDAAQFSMAEINQRDDVQTMKYSLRKLMNKTQSATKQRSNNFSL